MVKSRGKDCRVLWNHDDSDIYEKGKSTRVRKTGTNKQVHNYCLERRDKKKFKVINVSTSITLQKPLMYDFKIRNIKNAKRKFVPRKQI